MGTIFKVNYLTYEKKSVQEHLYVFAGEDISPAEFKKKPESFKYIFSSEELSYISDKNIDVIFIPKFIHIDDTINMVKRKIMNDCTRNSFGEIYLFGIQEVELDTFTIYTELTMGEKINLSKDRLYQFLQNLVGINVESLPVKDIFTYEDLLLLKLDGKIQKIKKPIGQQFANSYTVNPFDTLTTAKMLEPAKGTETDIYNLLFNNGKLLNNTIFFCSATDVLEYAQSKSLSEELFIKLYFPFLSQIKIKSLAQLNTQKNQLRSHNKEYLNQSFQKYNDNVDLFYNIYYKKTSNLDYNFRGIQQIDFIIRPKSKMKIPLEVFFKLIHATENIPFIKYNPGVRLENIYRLYTNQIAKNGKKIPALSAAKINILRKTLAKHKQLSLFLQYNFDDQLYELTCSFENNGDTHVKIDLERSIEIEKAENIINRAINPILTLIGNFLGQSGYKYISFKNLNDKNIVIKNISYILSSDITKTMNLQNYAGCLSSVFNIIEPNLEKGIKLRFKRTAHFNKMNSIDAYITQLYQMEKKKSDIINALKTSFDLTPQEANQKYTDFMNQSEVIATLHENRQLRIKNNPGFPVFIRKEAYKNTIIIQIENINSIQYLETLPIYIDTIIRLTQDIYSTEVEHSYINSLCGEEVTDEEETKVEDIKRAIKFIPKVHDEKVEDLEDDWGYESQEEEDLVQGESSVQQDENLVPGEVSQQPEQQELQGEWGFQNNQDDQDDQWGGAKGDLKINLKGAKVKISELFTSKMVEKDPILFLKKKQGKFSAYSRICPSNIRRQPVILTDAEKDKIDKEHPGSYSDAIKYGSEPSKQFWYICPRYWCLTGNYSLTEEEVKAGVCGGVAAIIPQTAKTIPEGGQIFEFTDPKVHQNPDGTYATHGPGFLKSSHPGGHCIPCCFKTWKSASQMKRKKECLEPQKKKAKKVSLIDDYIKGPEKMPLNKNRWGFLPLSVQKILQSDNKKCLLDQTKTMKQDHMCLLRQGVENNKTQSFVGTIADIYAKLRRLRIVPQIIHMKEMIIDAINIESFITFQGGTFIDLFGNHKTDISIEKYKRSKIFKNLKKDSKNHIKYFKKIVSAFENFIKFLRDEKSIINYEYLWDIICTPNPFLFTEGLNLIILNLPDNDITDNIELICPTNQKSFLDFAKPTFFLLSKNDFYEPIYGYTQTGDSIMVTATFRPEQRGISKGLKESLLFFNHLFSKCSPMRSMPKKYTFKENINLSQLQKELQSINYTIVKLIVNFSSKVIGVITQGGSDTGVLLCKPSPIDKSFEYVLMDDSEIWNNYKNTVDFLKKIYVLSNKKIPSLPHSKIEEDGMIVGILTITNQFIPLIQPQENLSDDLETIFGYNYLKSDETSLSDDSVDIDRIITSKKIKLESYFYNVFRNTMRILLQEYRFKKQRFEIEDIIKKPYIIYADKIDSIMNIMEKISENHIKFIEFSQDVIINIEIVSNCLGLDSTSCKAKKYCLSDDSANCKLLIPSKHLISGHYNKTIYFARMADELVRYGRIRDFVFKPRHFISFQKIDYNLQSDEIILLDNLLDEGYFEDLIPMYTNPFLVTKKTIFGAQPNKTWPYSNRVDMKKKMESAIQDTCISKKWVKGNIWKGIFKKNYEAINFNSIPICSWQFLAFIYHQFTGDSIEISQLKEILINEYENIGNDEKIIEILEGQKKKKLLKQVKKRRITLATQIMSEDYYITNLDLFMIINKYKIPTVIISGVDLKETGAVNSKKIISFLYQQSECFIIRSPASIKDYPKEFSIISQPNKFKFSILELPSALQGMIRSSSVEYSFDDYYNHFMSKKYRIKGKKKITIPP